MAFLGWPGMLDPWREMRRLSRSLDQLVAGARRGLPGWFTLGEFPPTNVYVTDDEILVTVALPGVRPDGVDLSVTVDTLVIRGARKAEAGEAVKYHHRERPMGEFVRSLTLADRIETGGVEAKYADGILTVRMPKAEEAKARNIPVARGE